MKSQMKPQKSGIAQMTRYLSTGKPAMPAERRLDYERVAVHGVYNTARALPPQAVELWKSEITPYVPYRNVGYILDLGCGTGRFGDLLQTWYPSARIVGVDPSLKMLRHAKDINARPRGVVSAFGEAIPLRDASVDMAFLSMVYHHFNLPHRVVAELARVVAHEGWVVVRNSTRENIDDLDLFRWFPEAQLLELARMPARDEVIRAFTDRGFDALVQRTVRQPFAQDYSEYFDKIRLRALSCLQLLDDDVFEGRLQVFRDYCAQRRHDGPVFEPVDLYIFRNGR
jgi:SAM-dependent methyltransferase